MRSAFISRLKRAARVAITGRESAFYDDELIGLKIKRLAPSLDSSLTGRRLNVVTPGLSASSAFGGRATVIELPILTFKQGLLDRGWQLRFICTGAAPQKDDNIASKYLDRHGVPPSAVTMHYRSASGEQVPVGEGDIFLGSLWYIQPAVLPLMQFQYAQFSGPRTPYISMVQDYEPGFHPWSSAYLLARASYDSEWPKRIIFNSKELATFYKAQGHDFDDSFTFEPILNSSLREALMERPVPPKKERRILFYGRPNSRRNCYFLARKSLEIWSERYEWSKDWRVISVGAKHKPFALANGAQLDVLGKLSLEDYAEELRRAALGLSLMASPHPSYPPLELAHFGALTICNSFDCKDLRVWHENLTPVDVPSPNNFAISLVNACRAFEANPSVGLDGRSLKPQYLATPDEYTLESIAAMIAR